MKRFYLTGQRTFGNRGCEAIVRSTISLLKEKFGEIKVFVPSDDIERDSRQWPDAKEQGVVFVPLYYPFLTRFWVQIQRLPIALVKRTVWPFPATNSLKSQLQNVDAVLSIGGDMYTYEGRLPSWIFGINQIAMLLGKPVVLWGATVGDFDDEPLFLPIFREHLGNMALIAVRESYSERYLIEKIGLNNVVRMPDSAFYLVPEYVDVSGFWPDDLGSGVLGLNVSQLIERFSGKNNVIKTEICKFIREVVEKKNISVLLVPHVTPLNDASENNDEHYMKGILEALSDLGSKVRMMRGDLNAVQTKYVISKCRFFIGARTHATIAALSSSVPTISIAYSIKAKGINYDLFGDKSVVVDLSDISSDVLFKSLVYLEENECELRIVLNKMKLDMKKYTSHALDLLDSAVFC